MYNVAVTRKVCATCKWWRAERELVFAGAREPRYVVVDGTTTKIYAPLVLAVDNLFCDNHSNRGWY